MEIGKKRGIIRQMETADLVLAGQRSEPRARQGWEQ